MNNQSRSLLLLALMFAYSHTAIAVQKKCIIKQLIKQINKKRNTNPYKAQEELLNLLSQQATLPTAKLASIVTALEKQETFPFLNTHSNDIDTALRKFDSTPGFNKTLQTFLINIKTPNRAKGFLYEMQKGVQLTQNKDETIEAFAQEIYIDDESPMREFDIFTDKRWIECKDVNWPARPLNSPSMQKTQQQLVDQQRIVQQYNKTNKNAIAYEVHSKQPISAPWKQWFANNKITCVEEKR
jgi:hypothetical protein